VESPFHFMEGSSGFYRSQLAPTREIPTFKFSPRSKGGVHHVSNEVMECGMWMGAMSAQQIVNYGIKSQRQLHWIKLVLISAHPSKEGEVGWSGPRGNSLRVHAPRMHPVCMTRHRFEIPSNLSISIPTLTKPRYYHPSRPQHLSSSREGIK
jgi:hypothetical protein